MGHPATSKQRIRSGDGGYSGRLQAATRRRLSAGLSGGQNNCLPIHGCRSPGRPARRDYEYERNGTANLFMMFAPLEGWRRVKVTDRRTAIDYAQALEDLSDRHFPNAKKIVLVQDNLNTHKPASLYEAFPPDKARQLVERFEWHYTPKHGSWLDMAESELAVPLAEAGSYTRGSRTSCSGRFLYDLRPCSRQSASYPDAFRDGTRQVSPSAHL